MNKLSGVVVSYNEEKYIETCIQSMKKVVDEIIVVDSFSTDKTVEIAKRLGARVILQSFFGIYRAKEFCN